MSGESDESKGKEEKPENILKVLDDLISHMHTTRHLFVVLIISSLIFAPIAMVVGGFLLAHPRFNIVRFMAEAPGAPETFHRLPFVAVLATILISISIIIAGIWLFIGIKEYGFYSKWNKRFRKYESLRDKIDKELAED